MTDTWDRPEDPATGDVPPLPQRLVRLSALTEPEKVADPDSWRPPEFHDLPEVAELLDAGWVVLEDFVPWYVLLPAVWPTPARRWLRDRLPRVLTITDGDGNMTVQSVTTAADDRWREAMARVRDEELEAAAEAGFPAPPTDRIWMLRSPWPWLGADMVLSLINRRAAELWPDDEYVPTAVGFARAAVDLFNRDDEALRSWWTGPDAEAAAAWERQGRTVAGTIAQLVDRSVTPEHLVSLGLDESDGLAWSIAVGLTGSEGIERIRLWRSLGVSTPPDNLYRLADLTDDEIRAAIDAGLDIDRMVADLDPYTQG